jgi:hypothetical protein
MAIPIAALAGAAIGGVAGMFGDKSSSTQSINLAPESEFEKRMRELSGTQFEDIAKILGGQSVSQIQGFQGQATEAQGGLDRLLSAFAQAGGRPTQEQIGQAQQYAGQIFQPEQVAMQQAFQDQEVQAQQAAARMGRSFGGDPILRAKLAQEQTRQQAQLGARQSSFASQYAQQIPGQAIGAQEALMNLRQGIASQAMQNRLNLLNMGSQLQQQERNFRLQTAGRTTTQESGGGIGGMFQGALAGAGTGMSFAKNLDFLNSGGYKQQWSSIADSRKYNQGSRNSALDMIERG